ncbi:MAG: hypothetical protein P5680_25295, partial [Limnospira sp. PMC 737.11]|uniref:hypothetical protein n=1 Tax=Limnospira sp. PMC 737.11 TaxID=2981095 RepID=UPI0028E0DDA1
TRKTITLRQEYRLTIPTHKQLCRVHWSLRIYRRGGGEILLFIIANIMLVKQFCMAIYKINSDFLVQAIAPPKKNRVSAIILVLC